MLSCIVFVFWAAGRCPYIVFTFTGIVRNVRNDVYIYIYIYTVVPVLRDHPVVPKKAASQDRWSLIRGSPKIGIIIILSVLKSFI